MQRVTKSKKQKSSLPDQIWETSQRGDLPTRARRLSKIFLAGEEREKHSDLEGQVKQITRPW